MTLALIVISSPRYPPGSGNVFSTCALSCNRRNSPSRKTFPARLESAPAIINLGGSL